MRDAYQQLESLDAEIRLLEAQKGDGWRGRIVVLLERKTEIRARTKSYGGCSLWTLTRWTKNS
jgi:hypothetical protein